ncbi:altronate dehydratase [Bradyrhizobium sp. CSA207]|uniref:UxaA family hydrolase n=1 Tax=Bradyrhizobium sp. CSA207 TaxID=2698826 RepID=UPI0023B16179|nr:altronate dehydratase family protein [Bradyrhizobium sp. CSA207]MDE5441677.1 altronate dehydratase [Bradyrhizobium sp. CSA207]
MSQDSPKAVLVYNPVIRMHPADNLVVARVDLPPGVPIDDGGLVLLHAVNAGNKIASRAIAKGEPILKYGTTIGFAITDIAPGEPIGADRIEYREFDRDYAFCKAYQPSALLAEPERATFMGFVREDGRVATRNYVGLVATVNCSATVIRKIAEWFTPERLADYPNVDGVVAFAHSTGCGMEQTGEPIELLRRTIGGYIKHPNIGAALVVGLGCERNQATQLLASQGLQESDSLRVLTMQQVGGTRATIEAGIEAVRQMLPICNRATRQRVPASHLKVGLQCGGSDTFSSITANPALGRAVETLTRHGGTAILSETPEIYGVEHTLTRRAATPDVAQKLVDRIQWWKRYSEGRDVQINGKVAPGNEAGGLANIFEKSLGSAMKGGTGPLMEVYKYAEPVTASGLVFMDTPGYDPVSATGQIAGGANLICFTTGRGSMFGAKPAPSIKLATNSPMYARLSEDMDINCGEILDGTADIETMGQRIFELMLAIASGEESKSESLGLGDNEFVPWQIGITG